MKMSASTKINQKTNENIKLLENQLVGREDSQYYYTKYEYSPIRLPMSEILLEEPILTKEERLKYKLRTTQLLSLFGIYVHFPSKRIIIRCQKNTSICINFDEFELQDVIIRSRRIDMFNQGKCVKGYHFLEDNDEGPKCGDEETNNTKDNFNHNDDNKNTESIESTTYNKGNEISQESDDISKSIVLSHETANSDNMYDIQGKDLFEEIKSHYEVLFGLEEEKHDTLWNEGSIIPILPIFIGFCRNYGSHEIEVIDFSDHKNYKKKLREINNNNIMEFILFQEVERDKRIPVQVNEIGNGFDLIMKNVLRYKITHKTFIKRIIRYFKNNVMVVDTPGYSNKGYDLELESGNKAIENTRNDQIKRRRSSRVIKSRNRKSSKAMDSILS